MTQWVTRGKPECSICKHDMWSVRVEPDAVARAHGAHAAAQLAATCIALAVESGVRPTALFVGGAPWHAKPLAVFPRLRARP